MATIVAFDWL